MYIMILVLMTPATPPAITGFSVPGFTSKEACIKAGGALVTGAGDTAGSLGHLVGLKNFVFTCVPSGP